MYILFYLFLHKYKIILFYLGLFFLFYPLTKLHALETQTALETQQEQKENETGLYPF